MDSLLLAVSTFSEVAMYVVILLFVIDVLALCIYASRIGRIGAAEGQVVTENRPLTASDSAAMGGSGAPGGKYWGKHKVLASRSMFVSDMSLVDGTATKAQRRVVHGMKLAAILFWLAWVCGGLTLLPSQPIVGAILIILLTYGFVMAVKSVRKGRADSLRKLQQRQASRHDRHKA